MEIISLTEAGLCEAASYAWKLCADNSARSYPLLTSEAEICEEFQKCLRDDGSVLLCRDGGEIAGVLSCYTSDGGAYLQTTGFYTKSTDAALLFLERISALYPASKKCIGVTGENAVVTGALKQKGYSLTDDTLDMRLDKAELRVLPRSSDVRRVNAANMPQYLKFHEAHFADYYWNAERIAAAPEFMIYAQYEGDAIVGGLFAKCYSDDSAEVFGIVVEGGAPCADILGFALSDIFAQKPETTSAMATPSGDEPEYTKAAAALGFRTVNRYCCYTLAPQAQL